MIRSLHKTLPNNHFEYFLLSTFLHYKAPSIVCIQMNCYHQILLHIQWMDYTREMQRGRGGEGYIYLCIIGCILQIYFPILVTNLIFNNATLKRIECLNTEAECMRRTHTFVIIKNKISVSHSFFYTNHCHLSDRK